MKTFQEKLKEVLEIKDPNEACISIATDTERDLAEIEALFALYAKEHGITVEEMEFYPDGERVLKPEMFS